MNRIDKLQRHHSWLTEDQARMILASRYFKFTRDLNLTGSAVDKMMDNCVFIYTQLEEPDMRDVLARLQEHYVTN